MAQSKWFKDLATPAVPALGFIELSSISKGLFVTDVLVKKAPVRVIASQPVSSGKHVVLFFGDVASVQESHQAAQAAAEKYLVKEAFIPAVHEQLVPFLSSLWSQTSSDSVSVKEENSISIVESQTLAGAILAADHALKTTQVQLCRMRLGQGIGGKAYFILTGKLEEIEAATDAAQKRLQELQSCERVDIIPRPQIDVLEYF